MSVSSLQIIVEDFYKDLIENKLPQALKDDANFKTLQKIVPNINEIKMMVSWSGFNDGDAEYAVMASLIGEWGDRDECYKDNPGGDGWELDWSDDTPHDLMIKNSLDVMSINEFEEFKTAYTTVSQRIFSLISNRFEFNDEITVRI